LSHRKMVVYPLQGDVMTSSRKKHHPPGGTTKTATEANATNTAKPKPAGRPVQPAGKVVDAAPSGATRRQWVIRVVAVLGLVLGVGLVLIGVTPGIAGGWGKLLLMVPGGLIIAGSFAAFVETTSRARSLRRRGQA
jgi:hypothetical protein